MEVASAKEPQGKPMVSGGSKWFHHGVITPWCSSKHYGKNLHLQVQFDNRCRLYRYRCGKP